MSEAPETKTLKVLFIQACVFPATDDGMRLEAWSRDNAVEVDVSFIRTTDNTVGAVTQHVLDGEYDAVVVEECHYFDKRDELGFEARAEAYAQLGLTKERALLQQMDPNCPYSGVALMTYLQNAFKEAGKDAPKFGYTGMGKEESCMHLFNDMGIEPNADFYFSYESPEEQAQMLYDVCGVNQG